MIQQFDRDSIVLPCKMKDIDPIPFLTPLKMTLKLAKSQLSQLQSKASVESIETQAIDKIGITQKYN